ncbi:MAG: ATP-binding protein, partial [Bacteroidota bacterium]
MKSPFKFLDAFDMEDKDVFFGRDLEIKDLYKKVSMSPLLLVYGLSGTGKTSLVSCGLAKNFNGPDWYPFFIRRKKDVNASLVEELTLATGDRGEESICEKLSFLYDRYLCPLYLIFDQFEEIFILGSQEEQEFFAENLMEIMEAEIPVKIILIMREEYLGDLYQLEQKISTIYDNRLRVETMRREKVKEVLKLSFSNFQIGLEGEDEDRLNQIVDNLSDEKSGIVQLPYLQVYLDMIYKEEFAKDYPGEVFDEENLKP